MTSVVLSVLSDYQQCLLAGVKGWSRRCYSTVAACSIPAPISNISVPTPRVAGECSSVWGALGYLPVPGPYPASASHAGCSCKQGRYWLTGLHKVWQSGGFQLQSWLWCKGFGLSFWVRASSTTASSAGNESTREQSCRRRRYTVLGFIWSFLSLEARHFHPWDPAAFLVQHSGGWVTPVSWDYVTVLQVHIGPRAAFGKRGGLQWSLSATVPTYRTVFTWKIFGRAFTAHF